LIIAPSDGESKTVGLFPGEKEGLKFLQAGVWKNKTIARILIVDEIIFFWMVGCMDASPFYRVTPAASPLCG
jgi:hypothetical protein